MVLATWSPSVMSTYCKKSCYDLSCCQDTKPQQINKLFLAKDAIITEVHTFITSSIHNYNTTSHHLHHRVFFMPDVNQPDQTRPPSPSSSASVMLSVNQLDQIKPSSSRLMCVCLSLLTCQNTPNRHHPCLQCLLHAWYHPVRLDQTAISITTRIPHTEPWYHMWCSILPAHLLPCYPV